MHIDAQTAGRQLASHPARQTDRYPLCRCWSAIVAVVLVAEPVMRLSLTKLTLLPPMPLSTAAAAAAMFYGGI